MNELAEHWDLDPGVDFLNHGSFGATPRPVLEAQAEIRAQMEAEPVRFFDRELEPLVDGALADLAQFLGASPGDIAFVANATTAVNAVLRSRRFEPGDELLTTDHAYPACRNALDFVARRWGARVVVAAVPFPPADPSAVIESIVSLAGKHTRLALVDHVTSPTGVIFPISEIVDELARRGIDTIVDGAHAPGMVPIDIDETGAAYYAGNCHKWLCAPKGAGFLHVRKDRQGGVVPTVISGARESQRSRPSGFRPLFDWTGTDDPSPALAVPAALEFMASLHPDGWNGVMPSNHTLALEARTVVGEVLGVDHQVPADMIGSMASLPLSDGAGPEPARDPLQEELFASGIEVPIVFWPAWPHRALRISAQLYNSLAQYRRLAELLSDAAQLARMSE